MPVLPLWHAFSAIWRLSKAAARRAAATQRALHSDTYEGEQQAI